MTFPLTLPSIGSTNWGTAVNNNWSTLNTAFGTMNPGSTYAGVTIWGVQDGTTASSGQVGEIINSIAQSVTPSTSGSWQSMTSISLTAGDWLVNAMAMYGGLAGVTAVNMCISTTQNNNTGCTLGYDEAFLPPDNGGSATVFGKHVVISSGATYWLNIQADFAPTAPVIYGSIQAVRIR